MSAHRFRLSLGVAVVGLMLGFGTAGDAAGQKKKATASIYAPIIHGLHQTHALLQQADHDYKGHRAKAAHQVTKAIHVLARHKKQPGTTTHAPSTQPRVREPQAVSDRQMRQAAQQLHVLLGQLSSLPATDLRAAEAIPHIRAAIVDIQTALKIR